MRLHLYDAGEKARVVSHDQVQWLEFPASDDGTARVLVFLRPAHCRRLAADLLVAADRADRIQAALRDAHEPTGARA